MNNTRAKNKGFVWWELIIALTVLITLGLFAASAFSNYKRRSYFNEIVQVSAPFKKAVTDCFHNQKTLKGCNAGNHSIPAPIRKAEGGIRSLSVIDGVITITPIAKNGIAASDNYILTPTVSGNTLLWTSSGESVRQGYAKQIKNSEN
ncbi:MAG: type 4 major prepilin protein [uncultured bacterium]|nr:MAG: type 4 major prepilin protein [uncultured bacterium]